MQSQDPDAVLVARAHANFAEVFRALARAAPHGAIEEADGVTLVTTGLPIPPFNPVFANRAPDDPAEAMARTQAFYRRARMPWLLRVSGEAAERLGPVATAAGLVARPPQPGMLLAPLTRQPQPAVPGLQIEVVSDAVMLRRYNDTLAAGFGMPRALLAPLDGAALLAIPDMVFYLGMVDGVPVTTAMRFTSQRIAGVFNIGTIPEYRKRGLGEAMTWRAALDGAEEGCVASYLQASPMGFPIYARMGFRHVASYATWEQASPSAATA